jgi:molybdate transport system substrate-binding protein
MRRALAAVLGATAGALTMSAAPVSAAELVVMSAEAPRDALEHIAAEFTRATGHSVRFAFMTAGQVRTRAPEADVAVTSPAVAGEMAREGKVTGPTNLGRIGLAVAIRDGSPAPDLSSPEAFAKAMVAARAVSFTNPAAGGTAGLYFNGLLQRLGIADAVNARAVYATGGRDAATRVANGEAELGITFPSEIIPIKGAKVAGMFPAELQSYTTYVAAVPAQSKQADLARALIAALVAPAGRPHWIAAGFEPPSGP